MLPTNAITLLGADPTLRYGQVLGRFQRLCVPLHPDVGSTASRLEPTYVELLAVSDPASPLGLSHVGLKVAEFERM